MAQTATKPPTTERGSIHEGGYTPGWGSFHDANERNENLQWPQSVETYSSMLNDSQIDALRRAVRLPQFRRRWLIDPNQSRPELVEYLATAVGLPVRGQEETRPRIVAGFSWRRHLADALRGLDFGHQYHQVVLDKDNPDQGGRLPLRKAASVPPRTIRSIDVDDDGGLRAIWVPSRQAETQDGANGTRLGVERLLAYVWEQEPGNWVGRSMLRSIYREWLAKDQLLRVDVVKHQRNGMGVPTAKQTDRSASPKDLTDATTIAGRWRAGDTAAAGLPFGTDIELKGVQGNLPDTLASIRYQDEAMARAFLAMFMQLGQTEHGSRALGEEFVDFFALAEDAVSEWVCDQTTLYLFVKLAVWAFGVDPRTEPIPFLVSERDEDAPVDASELAAFVREGLLVVDDEIRDTIRSSLGLPATDDPVGRSFAYDLDFGILTVDERRAQVGLDPLPDGAGDVLPIPSSSRVAEQPPAARAAALARVNERRGRSGLPALAARHFERPAATRLPDRPMRREPLDFEQAAAIDFEAIELAFDDGVDSLLQDWSGVRTGQVDELTGQIAAAASDLEQLATVQATATGQELLLARMRAVAQDGIAGALEEAAHQGVQLPAPDLDAIVADMEPRANAAAQLLARSLSEAASRRAVSVTGTVLTPADVAEDVRGYIEGLTDAYLRDQFNGLLTQAMGAGRRATMAVGVDRMTAVYASALLDANACGQCLDWDGHEFGTLVEAEQQFPTGGNSSCLGGPRCRCTLVAVYGESPASVQ